MKAVAGNSGVIAQQLGFHGERYRPEVMRRAHQHHELELNYLTAGSLTYLAAGRIVNVPAGSLAVFWAGAPHQVIAVQGEPEFFCFTIPLPWVLQWRLAQTFNETLLRGDFVFGKAGFDEERTLARWCEDVRKGDAEHLRIVQLELEARLRRLAAETTEGSTRAVRVGKISAVQLIAEFVARYYSENLSVAQIVKPTGLHPNYAMTLFRNTCGLSILDYVIEHRLFHARRLLATTELKVVDVAFQSGFGSVSRFNEAFLMANGCSPKVYRRRFAPR